MAKQIYIDENGNENLVSGTINNASLLPISESDTTDTKSYIDDGLSLKRLNFVVPIDAISSGASKAITANDANYTIPNGYKAVSYYVQYCYGSNTRYLNIWSCNLDATGTSTFIEVQNMGSGATTSGATITLVVLFAKTSRVSTTA